MAQSNTSQRSLRETPSADAAPKKTARKKSNNKAKLGLPERHLPNDVTKQLGEAIKAFRLGVDLSQMEPAHLSEIERAHIGRLESGKTNASVLVLASLCHALDINLPMLFETVTATLPTHQDGGNPRRRNQAVVETALVKGSRRSPLR